MLLTGLVGEVEPVIAILVEMEEGDPGGFVAFAKEVGVLEDADERQEGLEADVLEAQGKTRARPHGQSQRP